MPTKVEVVGPERQAFLDAALQEHLGAELAHDVPSIVASYAPAGHLNFNGVLYDTPDRIAAFHRNFGWDSQVQGVLSGLGGEIIGRLYTHDCVVVEYVVRGTVEKPLRGAPVGRAVEFPMCVIYQFDDAGKLASERIYTDTGALLPEPILEL